MHRCIARQFYRRCCSPIFVERAHKYATNCAYARRFCLQYTQKEVNVQLFQYEKFFHDWLSVCFRWFLTVRIENWSIDRVYSIQIILFANFSVQNERSVLMSVAQLWYTIDRQYCRHLKLNKHTHMHAHTYTLVIAYFAVPFIEILSTHANRITCDPRCSAMR